MKSRPNRITRLISRHCRFALNPLSFAICLGLSGAALALPQGGTVVAGRATISTPTPTSQVIRQTTDRAIIDWRSFSIASGERVRFYQPSSTSVTLNRVTGYDPSFILGQMSSNGRVFLVNPYGVVFGAGARVDVGGLVVSTLSLANNDFMAGRYSLTSVDADAPASRGAIRNEGTINAPGGVVVLAGPDVSNTGTITANGGRVGLVAANAVSVDVEGDGLLFFQTSATDARNRLEQLGRIQADGGTVEMRAAARGAFADTVLNMGGVVQARSLGSREGRVVVDGGGEGIVNVSGTIDASGAGKGQSGGDVTVLGQRVMLANGARIDASGREGGGDVRVGGDFHGANPELHNADAVVVQGDATIKADAIDRGNGGTVAIWSDGVTRYTGHISAHGGERGGNGGFVEVSGKGRLDFDGTADLRAPAGTQGTLLLDPKDITIAGSGDPLTGDLTFDFDPGGPSTITATSLVLQLQGSDVLLQANNDILVRTDINAASASHNLELDAGRHLIFAVTPNVGTPASSAGAVAVTLNGGNLTLRYNDNNPLVSAADRDPGAAQLFMATGSSIATRGGTLNITGSTGGASGGVTLGSVNTSFAGRAGGSVLVSVQGDGQISTGALTTSGAGGPTATAGGVVTLGTTNGSIATGAINADGGVGGSIGGGAVGGKGGNVTLAVGGTGNNLTPGTISTLGGDASDNSSPSGPGATGGAGGTVSLTNSSGGTTTLATITASGGVAGTPGGATTTGGDGGAGGNVSISSSGGLVTLANITSIGGAPTVGAAGAGGIVTIGFSQTAVGTLDVRNSSISAASASATAGGATSTLQFDVTGLDNATLGTSLARSTSPTDLALAGIDVASIVKSGTGTLDASGFNAAGQQVTIQFNGGAGAITGNGNNTTLTGQNAGSAFLITDPNRGTVDGTVFLGVSSLAGGDGADSFGISGTGSLTGTINGGTGPGVNSLSVTTTTADFGLSSASSGSATHVGGGFTNITSLTGNNVDSTLTGTNTGSTYAVNGAGDGTINATATAFFDMANLTGGTAADSFVFTGTGSLLGGVNGGAGAGNTLNLAGLTGAADFVLGATAGTGTATPLGAAGFSGIDTLAGKAATSTLTGRNVASTWTINADNAGNVVDGTGTTNFSGIAGLVGGTANDDFVIGPALALSSITGGLGSNSLAITAGPSQNLTLDDGQIVRTLSSTIALTDIGTATLISGSGTNALDGSGFSGNLTLRMSTGADVLTGNGTSTTLVTSTGGDTLTVNMPNGRGVTSAGGSFSGITSLLGNTGIDVFAVTATGSLAGNVAGVNGNDTLNLTGSPGSIEITQAGLVTGSTVAGTISGINTFIGNGAGTTFRGSDSGQAYAIDSGDHFTVGTQTLGNIGNITAGAGDDSFTFGSAGSLSGTLNGGGGTNSLDISARAAANIALTGAASGTADGIGGTFAGIASLTGNALTTTLTGTGTGSTYAITGADGVGTITGGPSIAGIRNLVGGGGDDTFSFANGATLSGTVNGGAGNNTLDYATRTTANFGLGTATSGNASGIAGYSNVGRLVGNGSNSTLTGSSVGSTFTVSGGTGTVVGGGTTNFSGMVNLAGGAGADTFVVNGTLAGSIDGGGGINNRLDLSGLGTANFVLSTNVSGTASSVGGGFNNINQLVGNNSSSTLTGSGTGTAFAITSGNGGTVNGSTTFGGIVSLTGGGANDSFSVNGGTLAGSIDGGGGSNSLSVSGPTANFVLNTASSGTATGVALGYSNVTTLAGNNSNSTLTGTDAASTYSVGSTNTGTLNDGTTTVNFSGIRNLVGGNGNDAFVLAANAGLGSITGNGGTNSLTATANGGEDLVLSNGLLDRSLTGSVTLSGIGRATLIGDAGDNALDGFAFGGALSLQLSGGSDSLFGNNTNTTLIASTAGGVITVSSLNSGNYGTSNFFGVTDLRGNSAVDTFRFAGAAPLLLTGNVTGVGGNDTLDLFNRIGTVTISQSGATTGSGVGGIVTGVTGFRGNGGTTTFIGNDVNQTYTITGTNAFSVGGQNLTDVGSIRAGELNDVFLFQAAGVMDGTIDGRGGSNTLNVAGNAGNIALSSATAGSTSSIGGGYTNIATLIGNGTTSTLTASAAPSAFAVTGSNSGTVTAGGTTNFSGMASLVGGAGADTFTVSGTLSGSIDGGAGSNTLSLASLGTANFGLTTATSGSASNVGGGYLNVGTLVGNDSNSTLTGTNTASTYHVTGAGSGDVDGATSFSGIANLIAGAAADNVIVTGSLSGSVNGGGGINRLDLAGLATANFGLTTASSGTASNVGGGYSNVTQLVGNNTSSTLTGTNTGSIYSVTGVNTGTVNDFVGTTGFSGVVSLSAGTAADLFAIVGGSLTGNVNGGTGALNTLNLSSLGTANFGLTSFSSGTASNVGGGYSNITALIGNGTTSTLTGTNTASTYSVTGNNSGTVNDGAGTTNFAGVPNLVGGTSVDAFNLSVGAGLGSIDGGTGAANTLADAAAVSENLTLSNGQLGRSVSGNVGLANIASATLTGGTGNNVINAAGWTGGRTLTVTATTGADSLVGNGVGTTLIGLAASSTFNLTGADTGVLTSGANTTSFSGVGNLTGGASGDIFVIQNAGTLTGNLDGGGGLDTLDLSNKASATLVFSSDGAQVTGAGITGSTNSIEKFIGNVANTTLQGLAAGQSFVITGDNEITVDGSQVFQGVGTLASGTGIDSISGSTFRLAGSISDAGGATNLSGTIRTDGSQTYLGAITAPSVTLIALGGLTAVNAGNDFGTVSLTGGAINLRDTDAIDLLSVTVGAGQALAIASGSTITLNGNVATTADQSYTGNLLLATNAALTAGPGSISITGSVDGGTHDLALSSSNVGANAIAVGGTVGNVGTFAAAGNARLGGSVTSTGTQTYAGTLALDNDATLDAGAGKVDLQQAVDGRGHNLTVTSGNAAADAIHVGGAVGNTAQFTANGPSTVGANVVTTGNQLYNGNVLLASNATLDAGAATLRVQGNLNGGAHNLNLGSTAAAANAITITGSATNLGTLGVAGNASLGGNVTSIGNQTYTGTVALSGDATLNAGGGKLDLQQAVDANGHVLGLASSNISADAIHAGAAIANATQLTVTGRSTLATGVTTTGAQLYTDTVTLGSSSNFVGSSLGFGNGIVAGAFDLGLRADSLNLAGVVSGSGNGTISTLSQGASVGIAGGAGTLQLDQATLDRFAGFASLTLGRADGTGNLTFGNLVLPTQLSVISASGDANFTGTVASAAGQGRDLSVATGGTNTFSGAVGGPIGGGAALGDLTVGGATRLDADLTANGNVSLAGPVTIGADATLSTETLAFGSSVAVGNHAVTLFTDGLTVAGTASGTATGSVRIATRDTAGTIGIAGGAGTLQLSQGLIDTFAAVPTLALGRSDGSGTITVGTLVLPTDLAITSGTGNVAFTGTVDSAAGPARDLTVDTAGTTTFAGTLGITRALDAITVSGASQIGANIVSTGAQTYTGAATLTGDSTLTGPSVAFGSTVDGARALTVNATTTSFGAAVGSITALTSLTTDASGSTQLNGNVTTSAAQTYNDALQLNSNAILTGSTLTLAGTVDGAHALVVNGSTAVTLGGAIGGGTALTSLGTSGPLQLSAGNVVTTGAQSYAGATTLGANTALNASSISFGGSIDGAFGLALQSAGPTTVAGAVGANAALASLTASGGGAVQIGGAGVTTTGAQSYSGALQLTGASTLTGASLALAGAVSGATDLTLRTDALTGGSSITGSGVLTIAPLDPTLSIGISGGAGTLQISQALLDGATSFTGHIFGRADGSGTLSAGNLQLRADTTLQTNTGDINLGGSVDGSFALALNSGGTTRITGPVGTTNALRSLVTDNNAAAADWNGSTGEHTTFDTADGTGAVRIVTSGAQTYGDPVTATVPVSFVGAAITATQATNRFDGVITANATSLDLRNSVDLQLGAITLTNGGTLETDGVLHIGGALQLNGGVLLMRSNATPTPIDLTDPEYAGRTLTFGFVPVREASATIVQDAGGSVSTAAGSVLVLRSPEGGSLLLEGPGNALLGGLSAVSGTLGETGTSRFDSGSQITLGFIRVVSSEIHVVGRPPTNGDQTLTQAGLEGDVIKLTADVLTTGTDGLIRARLPFNNIQGSTSSVPGLTLVLSPNALLNGGGFGSADESSYIQVQVGGTEGGFITARPHDASGNTAVIFLGGDADVRPFYDGAGRLTEIRIFYNGNAPRTPQEAGALAAVIALIEEARHARFEEAVRTENVSSRLRSGVIAEVGAGRPATVGRESIRLPDTCEIKPKTLQCE